MVKIAATGPAAEPRKQSQRPKLPGFSVGAAIGAMAAAVGQAFSMAYVAPYQMGRRRPPASTEAADGRAPLGEYVEPLWSISTKRPPGGGLSFRSLGVFA